MAHIEESGGGRETNVELNLVPFIDLMSVCIIFLLITAVWTQISMIQIGSSVYGKKSQDQQAEPPPKEIVPLRLNVKSGGYIIRMGKTSYSIPKVGGKYDDAKLLQQLKIFKEQNPDATTGIISLEDALTYESMIRGMDLMMLSGFPEITVATGEES
jgi:biopolymer transport protein ExbD